MSRRLALLFLIGVVAISSGASAASTVTVVNQDGPGEGFNDTTPVSPVGGNSGTTLGEQRLIAFEFAAQAWENFLDSSIEIFIGANFDPLSCSPTSGVVGAAGTTTVHRDFSGAPATNTWYPQALANSLAGSDLDATNPDVGATFNSDIDDDDPNCLTGITWYLGLDGNNGNDIDLVDVVMHEIGHGIGFSSFVDESTGSRFFNRMDIFSTFLEDHSTGQLWGQMNNQKRKTSAKDTGDLHWVGTNVVNASGHVQMYAPNPVEPGSSVSHWDTAVAPDELMEPFITDPPIQMIGLAAEAMLDIGWNSGGGGAVCGDGVREGAEECDGSDFGTETCGSNGCTGGFLTCTGSCTIDTSTCTGCACVPTHSKEKGPRCSDGLDNDCDLLIDGADPDC